MRRGNGRFIMNGAVAYLFGGAQDFRTTSSPPIIFIVSGSFFPSMMPKRSRADSDPIAAGSKRFPTTTFFEASTYFAHPQQEVIMFLIY